MVLGLGADRRVLVDWLERIWRGRWWGRWDCECSRTAVEVQASGSERKKQRNSSDSPVVQTNECDEPGLIAGFN